MDDIRIPEHARDLAAKAEESRLFRDRIAKGMTERMVFIDPEQTGGFNLEIQRIARRAMKIRDRQSKLSRFLIYLKRKQGELLELKKKINGRPD